MSPQRLRASPPREGGIALFQVLVLTTLLSLLALTFASEARDKVAQAQALENRVRAAFLAHSGEALALFYSLAPDAAARQALPCEEEPGTGVFNWHGAPLCPAPGLRIRLQDLSGLLPLAFPEQPLWRPTLTRLGLSEDAQDRFLGTLADAQDRNGQSFRAGEREPIGLPSGRRYANGPLQRRSFLRALTNNPDLHARLAPLTQRSGVVAFNPRFAPELLLRAAYGDAQGSAFFAQRAQGNLDLLTLRSQAPLFQDRELLSFSTSGSSYLRIYLEAVVETGRQRQELLVQLTPRAEPAYRLLQRLQP
jgi:type II secretory pathway component PulK